MALATNEFAVIAQVAEELAVLDKGGIRRALNWLSDYYAVDDIFDAFDIIDDADAVEDAIIEESMAEAEEAEEVVEAPAEPETFEDFFAQVAPKTAIQKAVTAAYWLQTTDGKQEWKSFDVNKLLRQIGVKISSISGTLAIDEKKETPLVEQLSKSGDSMQARKTFRLSDAGKSFVEDRIA